MGGIVVCGAGVCGLVTAMMLATDGHEVTVLERDAAPAPEPGRAWDDWERRSLNQFRLPHFLMPAFRELMEVELPDVVPALVAGGALRYNLVGPVAELFDPDGHHVVVTARRPLLEAVLARLAEDTPGVTVRRGVVVAGLVTDGQSPPRVTGLRTEDGEELTADLVVDAGGRRSPLSKWLVEAGAAPPIVEEEDSGFVYYGRHVRAPEGIDLGGPSFTLSGSVGLLVLPADDDISGIGIIACSDDAQLRVLRKEGPWTATMNLLPQGDQILGSEFVSPLVAMASIEDRWRRFVVDGRPVATGVVSVGDAWAATNPTLGRGISLALRHAAALRHLIGDQGLEPERLVLSFDEVTEAEFTPWYRSTVWHDRHRLGDMLAAMGGEEGSDEERLDAEDPLWNDYRRFMAAARHDPAVLLPRLLTWLHLTELPEHTLADPVVRGRLDELGAKVMPDRGPSRAELLEAVGA